MSEESLEEFLDRKIRDGSVENYENALLPYISANIFMADAIKLFVENLKLNEEKYAEVFDTLEYEPQYRTSLKEFEGVYTKIYDGKYKESEIFEKIPDIGRARIVCRTLSQTSYLKEELVNRFLVAQFDLKLREQKDYSEGTSSGYKAAVHYVFEIPQEVIQHSGSMLYELQIRTEMQHTWAELSHILFYKNRKLKELKKDAEFLYEQMKLVNDSISVIDKMLEEIRKEVKRKSGTL